MYCQCTSFHLQCHDTVSWAPSSCKTMTQLFYIMGIMAADDLTTPGARAWATMILNKLNRDNTVFAPYGFRKDGSMCKMTPYLIRSVHGLRCDATGVAHFIMKSNNLLGTRKRILHILVLVRCWLHSHCWLRPVGFEARANYIPMKCNDRLCDLCPHISIKDLVCFSNLTKQRKRCMILSGNFTRALTIYSRYLHSL